MEAIEAVLSENEGSAAYGPLGHGYQPGQDFRPPPGRGVGFELSGHGIPPENAADFSDFFGNFFGELFSHTLARRSPLPSGAVYLQSILGDVSLIHALIVCSALCK